jgi:hypothetical protein
MKSEESNPEAFKNETFSTEPKLRTMTDKKPFQLSLLY